MEKAIIKVGAKFGTEHYQVEIPVELPATWAEWLALDIPDDVKAGCATRGWRIRLQEQSGARDAVEVLTVDERKEENRPKVVAAVTAIIGAFQSDPTAKRPGRPSTPQEVVIPADAMSKKALAEMTAALAAQGIKVTIK